jgi:hypothetical protein
MGLSKRTPSSANSFPSASKGANVALLKLTNKPGHKRPSPSGLSLGNRRAKLKAWLTPHLVSAMRPLRPVSVGAVGLESGRDAGAAQRRIRRN